MLSFAASPALALLDLWWGGSPSETGGSSASKAAPAARLAESASMPGAFSWALTQATQIGQATPTAQAGTTGQIPPAALVSEPKQDVDEDLSVLGTVPFSGWRPETTPSVDLEAAAQSGQPGGLAMPSDAVDSGGQDTKALEIAVSDPLSRDHRVPQPEMIPPDGAAPQADTDSMPAAPALKAASKNPMATLAATAKADAEQPIIALDPPPETSATPSASPEEPTSPTPTTPDAAAADTTPVRPEPTVGLLEVLSSPVTRPETDASSLPADGNQLATETSRSGASEPPRSIDSPRPAIAPVAPESGMAEPIDASTRPATDAVKNAAERPPLDPADRVVVRVEQVANSHAPAASLRLDQSLADIAHRVAAMARPESAAPAQNSGAEIAQPQAASKSAPEVPAQIETATEVSGQRPSDSGRDTQQEAKQDLPNAPASDTAWKSSGSVTEASLSPKAQPSPDLHAHAMRSVASTVVRIAEDGLLASAAPRRATVELSPSHLGRVQIEVVQDSNRSLTVHLSATAEHTRMALEADADDLVEHLRHHSLDVHKVEVKGESDPHDGRGRDSLRQRSDDGLSREGRQSSEGRRDRGAPRQPRDFTDYRYWEAIR